MLHLYNFISKNLVIYEKSSTFALAFDKSVIKHRGVAQLVAHLVWDQVVARSSRVTPTKKQEKVCRFKKKLYLCSAKNKTVPWMSGLVSGLQNQPRRFESARHLQKERYITSDIAFFF